MQRHLAVFLLPLLLLAGCVGVKPENLSDEAKRDIYQYVREEVSREKRAAELAQKRGELTTTAKHLARVHLLDPSQGSDRHEVERLADLGKSRSEEQYRRGMLALEVHKRTALLFFARALRINPNHVGARHQSDLLLKEPHLAAEVKYLEDRITTTLRRGHSRTGSEALDNLVTDLLALDAFNPLARKVRDDLDLVRADLETADPRASEPSALQEVPTEQKPSAEEKQSAEQEVTEAPFDPGHLEQLGTVIRDRYAAGDYRATLALLHDLVTRAGDHPEALALAAALKGELAGGIPAVMEQGRALFDRKLLDEALVLFRCVLEIAPGEAEALVYIRKIESRLRTIEQLG